MFTTLLALPSAQPQQVSAEKIMDASTAVPIGTSGKFFRLANEGSLPAARRLYSQCEELRARLRHVQRGLDKINDERWLFGFSKTFGRRSFDLENALRARIFRLDAIKVKLTARLDTIQNEYWKLVPPQTERAVEGELTRNRPLLSEMLAHPDRHPVWTVHETQEVFRKSRSTIYRWLEEGRLERASLNIAAAKRGSCLILSCSIKKALEKNAN